MKLTSIKAFGFKTFAEPTTLEFSGGITAIVGPNGSGKSNLVDAFRWALGEQSSKSLRSGKMEDVIFAGNEKRKPLGLADVSVTFDNSDRRLPIDFSEVEITRRAYRAGEIEYYINRNQCRLRDVMDLIMGTGFGPGSYAMVSQGQIDAVLTSKPTERRALFEETAGIAKFLARKNESLRRLEHTEHNAIRINDVIAELDRRIPELDTQVRRAKRYRKLNTRVRDLEILSYLRASASRRREREALKNESEHDEELRSAAAAKAATLGAQLAEARTRAYQQELALEELRDKTQTTRAELARLETDRATTLARHEALDAQNTQTSEDAERVAGERESLQHAIESMISLLTPLQAELEIARERELQAQTELSAARSELDGIFTRLRQVEADSAESAGRKAERRVQGETARAEAERLDREAEAARARAEKVEIGAGAAAHQRGELERQLKHLETQSLDARGRLEDAEQALAAAQSDLSVALTKHRDYASEVAAAESRLHTIEELENSLEGHVPGTRAIVEAWQRGELAGIEGIVSNLIETGDQYARAMDVAFGARLSNIVTRTSEDAERAVDFLNLKEVGRATFLPLDTLRNRTGRELSSELRNMPGIIGYAHTLVRTKPQYEGIVRFLVGSVLVVDTLRTGIDLVRNRGFHETIVTLSGEQITGGGAITGGRYKRERSILSRRAQAQSLREQLTELRARLSESESEFDKAVRTVEDTERDREGARETLARVELKSAELRAQMTAAAAEAERLRAEFEALDAHVRELHAQAAEARSREHELEQAAPEETLEDEERTRLEAALSKVRERISQAEANQAETAAHGADVRERVATLSAEREAASARLGLLDADGERARRARERMVSEIAELAAGLERENLQLEKRRAEVQQTDAEFENARRERETLSNRVTQLESDVRMAELEERDAAAAGEHRRMRLAEIEAELGMLVSQFAQNPATDEECRDVEQRHADEPDSIADDLPRLREELARLSNVNLNAEADRTEIAERQTFLQTQLDDLARARETLLQSIREIELQTQAQFNEAFEKVARAFAETYERLFSGGQARMWQTDPEHLSESGIEIAVQPPGKKAMPLTALSGGERAMTAVALIFALIKVKPSPFYLLDEVDAALDDANVERFSDMVRETVGDSQMILVTHNKQTMELADRLYGVTMTEPGISSIVSVELADRERRREPAIA